jgi:hypothetical protein
MIVGAGAELILRADAQVFVTPLQDDRAQPAANFIRHSLSATLDKAHQHRGDDDHHQNARNMVQCYKGHIGMNG